MKSPPGRVDFLRVKSIQVVAIFVCAGVSLFAASVASAHPAVNNGMEVVVHADRVAIKAKISLPQIDIAHTIDESGTGPIEPAKLRKAADAHGPYLLSHLRVLADDVPLEGKLFGTTMPQGEVTWASIEHHEVVYDLEYALPKARPATVRIEQEMLKEFSRLGQGWVVMFVVQTRQAHEAEFTQLLLTREEPLEIPCEWKGAVAATVPTSTNSSPRLAEAGKPAVRARATSWTVARQFTVHGFEHIVTGYDHLLFVAALVIAATRLLDLVAVVTAFAVAHTLTLTLSVLDVVRLPSSVVEPVIAASIVFVALQNVIFPRQSRGAARLVIAFAFGLFHGLGFAGGLLAAMEGMPATNLIIALLSFTLGVELAHQVLIVPLYFLLKPLRRTPADDATETPLLVPRPLRLASLAISAAGVFYLVQALRGA